MECPPVFFHFGLFYKISSVGTALGQYSWLNYPAKQETCKLKIIIKCSPQQFCNWRTNLNPQPPVIFCKFEYVLNK